MSKTSTQTLVRPQYIAALIFSLLVVVPYLVQAQGPGQQPPDGVVEAAFNRVTAENPSEAAGGLNLLFSPGPPPIYIGALGYTSDANSVAGVFVNDAPGTGVLIQGSPGASITNPATGAELFLVEPTGNAIQTPDPVMFNGEVHINGEIQSTTGDFLDILDGIDVTTDYVYAARFVDATDTLTTWLGTDTGFPIMATGGPGKFYDSLEVEGGIGSEFDAYVTINDGLVIDDQNETPSPLRTFTGNIAAVLGNENGAGTASYIGYIGSTGSAGAFLANQIPGGTVASATLGTLTHGILADGPLGGLAIEANGDVLFNDNLTVSGATAERPGGGPWDAVSDARVKDVKGEYTKGLDEIVELNPVEYSYKEGNEMNYDSTVEYVGLIAQEVQNVFPEAVSETVSGLLQLDANPINVALINAVKELKAQNDELKEEVAALKELVCLDHPEAEVCQ